MVKNFGLKLLKEYLTWSDGVKKEWSPLPC